ncbi:MAG: hypothetical protein R3F46_00930 [bacterium]
MSERLKKLLLSFKEDRVNAGYLPDYLSHSPETLDLLSSYKAEWMHEAHPGRTNPFLFLEAYAQLMWDLSNGYRKILIDYVRELSTRVELEEIMTDPGFLNHPGSVAILEMIDDLDNEFRALTVVAGGSPPEGEEWWTMHYPKSGCGQLVREIRERTGIAILQTDA